MRHEWANGWWEMETAPPHPALRGVVRGDYCGWTEQTTQPVIRREVASTIIPLIINFGDAYRLHTGTESIGVVRHSFVAGVYDTWVRVASASAASVSAASASQASVSEASVSDATRSCALQVNLTPIGAHRVLACDMDALTGQSVELSDVLGAEGRVLIERLATAPTWQARFALVDVFLRMRLDSAAEVPAEVQWVWDQLALHEGAQTIGALTRETGWSPKRLSAAFHTSVGVPPKSVARLLRFERVIARLQRPDVCRWAARALDSGYYDQSHLVRDFTEFAGCTPTAYLRERLTIGGGDPSGIT
jgi:AraC-like DNA-binding protein